MCSGRFMRSGSVVYSSRTKPWNALPPRRSSLKPCRPETVSTAVPGALISTRVRARSGPVGVNAGPPGSPA